MFKILSLYYVTCAYDGTNIKLQAMFASLYPDVFFCANKDDNFILFETRVFYKELN